MNSVSRFPTAVLFDLGDTLLREVRLEPQAAIARLVELGNGQRPVDRQRLLQMAGALYQEIRGTLRSGICEVRMQGFLQLVCDCHGIALAQSMDDVELEFWKALCSMEPLPGVKDALIALCDRGIKCGVISNSVFTNRIHRYELQRHGLDEYFACFVSSADYGIQKPHASIFEAALAKLNCTAAEAWFVGDNMEKDILGAARVGMRAVWFNEAGDPQTLPEGVARIRIWNELLRLLLPEFENDFDGSSA